MLFIFLYPQEAPFPMPDHPEAFSRILIDRALSDSGWDLLDSKQVRFGYHTGTGRADYLQLDKAGRVLCILEAKRENLDPYDAKEQARGYAENLNAPFIILSKGRESWFWNYEFAARVSSLRSLESAQSASRKNLDALFQSILHRAFEGEL